MPTGLECNLLSGTNYTYNGLFGVSSTHNRDYNYSFTFKVVGAFDYFCLTDSAAITATVDVIGVYRGVSF